MKSKFFNRHSKILVFDAGIELLFAEVMFDIMQNGVSAKEAELVNLKAALQELQEENSELDYLINDADEAELFEHLARDRGYVYPDEKIYYNVTPGN